MVLTLCCTLLAPAVARADGFLVPYWGANFSGDSGSELLDAFEAKRNAWGVSLGFMGAGVFGVEADWSYSPDFFGTTDLGGSSVSTLMGNFLIGAPFGGQKGFGVRPYGLVGLGLMHPNGDAFSNVLDFGENKFSWDVGGGVMIFFTSHVGIRGDLRYLRTLQSVDFLTDSNQSDLDFARGSIGFLLRF
jgi:opacity protein-like surface antigen